MKALIVGAGIAGLTTAKALADNDWQVTVIERAPGPRSGGYMMDFFGPGFAAAERMNLLLALQERAYDVQEVVYYDDAGRRTGAFNVGDIRTAVNGRLLSIMRPDMEEALRVSLPPSVQVEYGLTFTDIQQSADGVSVALTDGRTVPADLLVGADGIHSAVRTAIFGDEHRWLRPLGYHTASYIFSDPALNAELAGQFTMSDTRGRQLGLYALTGGDVAAFLVYRTDAPVPADPRAALQRAFAGAGWRVPQVLSQLPEEFYYDVVAQVALPDWHRGRVVLAGDACQAVSLLAGQGSSLAIAGAEMLARCLPGGTGIRATIDGGVSEYEERWRPVIEESQRAGRRAAGWFLPSSRLQLWTRRAIFRLARLPGINRRIAGSLAGKGTGV